MENSMLLHYCFLSILILSLCHIPTFAASKHYIVYLGSHHAEPRLLENRETITNSHHDLISSVSKSNSNSSERIIYSYNKIFNAFGASLLEEEANELAKHPKVVSVFESKPVKLLTTRSADFLGLSNPNKEVSNLDECIWKKASFGEDIIIATMDSGVWPESLSFTDEGLGPVPIKFKGVCANENDPTFKCNKKLIGARYFYKGLAAQAQLYEATFNDTLSPRDHNEGHGTHTLSTAGGNFVSGASWKGFANGTAKGMAPRARLVAYKNGWKAVSPEFPVQGNAMDLLAAFEAAVDDGVDIINLSEAVPFDDYFEDVVTIASFHAMKNGILTVASAGNDGPQAASVENIPPWTLTVAASTSDREFTSFIVLGNQQMLKGARFLDVKLHQPNTLYPLITGAEARNFDANITEALWCEDGTLDAAKVTGKIVVCRNSYNASAEVLRCREARRAGAVGIILANDEKMGFGVNPGVVHMLATVIISYKDGETLFSYINSTRDATAAIGGVTTTIGVQRSPVMAPFSSRGPNTISPAILKPDVTAPGVDILAAYPPDIWNSPFIMQSGTSMSTPHVTGIAALIKKLHPDWSTAAIKSAIMTTATPLDNIGMPIRDNDRVNVATPFAYGSGHVRPNLAMDPGLVYELNQLDYLNFLCLHPHNSTSIEKFNEQHSYTCPPSFSILDFNYPSISIPDFTGNVTATRKLKNVGQPSTYVPRIESPPGVSIIVEPKTLVFSTKDQEIMYKLIVTGDVKNLPKEYVFGSLVWSDGKHVVRSPIVIRAKN